MSFLSHDDSAADEDCGSVQLFQEILLSYRLLFGQSRAARKTGRGTVHDLAATGQFDRLLIPLCTKPAKSIRQLPEALWPLPCRDVDGKLQEVESYSSQDDFPILGHRLVALQEFNNRQQPSRLRDLWKDRRSP